jgi:hypothetical protein
MTSPPKAGDPKPGGSEKPTVIPKHQDTCAHWVRLDPRVCDCWEAAATPADVPCSDCAEMNRTLPATGLGSPYQCERHREGSEPPAQPPCSCCDCCFTPLCALHGQKPSPRERRDSGVALTVPQLDSVSHGQPSSEPPAEPTRAEGDACCDTCGAGFEVGHCGACYDAAEERARLAEEENKRLVYEAASPRVGAGARGLADALLDATDCNYPACPGAISTQDVQRICDVFLAQENTALRERLEKLTKIIHTAVSMGTGNLDNDTVTLRGVDWSAIVQAAGLSAALAPAEDAPEKE